MGLCETKPGAGLLSVFPLAVFRDILIYTAADGFNKNPHGAGKYLALFFGVMVFIFRGFERCAANMYCFSMAGMWSGRTALYLLVMTLGNSAGGVRLPPLRGWLSR